MPKINFITQGCSSNLRESEIMMGLLENSGFDVTNKENESDVNVVNICTVKGDTTALREIRRLKKQHPEKKLVVAGCITESIIPKIRQIDESASFVNTHNLGRISTVVDNSLNGTSLELLDKKYEQKVNLPSVRKNPVVGIVPILNGCNYFCTFCSTKLVKGKLFSYPMDAVRQDVKEHLKSGCREIWITSNDTGAYMVEQGGRQKLVELLEQILSVPFEFKVRVGMMNPGNTLPILDELIKIYRHPKMFKFLHVPLQSGNNEILKLMNRKYSVEDFIEVAETFREEMPEITISTDMIVGFPSETDNQFEDSLNILRKIKPDVLNLSRYAAREGTIAAKMKQFATNTLKQRSRIMTNLYREIAYENNKKWLNWQGKILIDEEGKNNSWIGRNYSYKPVVVKGDFKLGDEINVKINDCTSFDLRAEATNYSISNQNKNCKSLADNAADIKNAENADCIKQIGDD
ncbi:tRNA (N(6)-L-threonylcarbamoyladenosine(37)-C(2))-methylthiotransferase [Candidatus Woesearchaeota archaeon]|nr:tRNA (N(6)-L-threonylcarbamoyladenosine(37)-C(2))-methylthiotransferase [Candidatus Woesearchaeota archaeon]